MASGFYGKAKGVAGTALFLVRRSEKTEDYGRILFAKALIVGQDGVKPEQFYMLDPKGEPVEVE
jgi:hypothetical protein